MTVCHEVGELSSPGILGCDGDHRSTVVKAAGKLRKVVVAFEEVKVGLAMRECLWESK
jgi:hypothetical protein